MQYFEMDKLLVDIYKIENIEYIKFFDIISGLSRNLTLIPAVMIVSNNGKVFCLCERDKYFDIFVRKVVQVYNDEKNKSREDNLVDPFGFRKEIEIDDKTKKILENGELEKISDVYSFYADKDSYSNSLLFQKNEIEHLMKIICYQIKKFFGFTDVVVGLSEIVNGYRDYYTIDAKVNGVEQIITLMFNKVDNNSYEVSIGGILSKNIPVLMSISFSEKGINIATYIKEYDYYCTSDYCFDNEVAKEVYHVKKNGNVIIYENMDLPVSDNSFSNITDLDCKTDLSWYSLPWGGLIGIKKKDSIINEEEFIEEYYSMIVEVDNERFYKKEFYNKKFCRKDSPGVSKRELMLDKMEKNVYGLLSGLDNLYIIETNFVNDGVLGYYGKYLSGKFFYHVVLSDSGVLGIISDNLVPIGKSDDFVTKADLMNNGRLLKLVKGD